MVPATADWAWAPCFKQHSINILLTFLGHPVSICTPYIYILIYYGGALPPYVMIFYLSHWRNEKSENRKQTFIEWYTSKCQDREWRGRTGSLVNISLATPICWLLDDLSRQLVETLLNGICRGTEHRYIQFVHPESPRCIVWQDKLYIALEYSCNIYLPFHHVKNIIPIIFAKEKFTPHKYSPSSPSPSLTAWAEAV